MFENILSAQEQELLSALMRKPSRIVVTCHINPDGDAIGSMTAMASIMRRLGHTVTAITPDAWPDFLKWIPGCDEVLNFTHAGQYEAAEKAVREADLIVMMDHNATSRMKELGELVAALPTQRIMIDHHLDPEAGCILTVSQPNMCATCEVLFRVMWQMGWAESMTHDEAVSLYTGMMTDTGAFTYASNRPEVFEIIAQLLRKGIDKDKIYRNVFYTASADRMRLTGFLLYVKMEVLHEYHAAIISLSNKERRLFQTKNGDTEGIVNMPLQIKDMRLSIFLRQDTEQKNKVRVSMRSVDDFPCNEMAAQFFNGGGHKNASGGSLTGSLDEAIETAKKAIKAYEQMLK